MDLTGAIPIASMVGAVLKGLKDAKDLAKDSDDLELKEKIMTLTAHCSSYATVFMKWTLRIVSLSWNWNQRMRTSVLCHSLATFIRPVILNTRALSAPDASSISQE
jgi:hypothetical protein